MGNEFEILGNELPVAIAVEKSARFTGGITFTGKGILLRIIEVTLQTPAQCVNPVRKHAAQQDYTIVLERFDIVVTGRISGQFVDLDRDARFLPVHRKLVYLIILLQRLTSVPRSVG